MADLIGVIGIISMVLGVISIYVDGKIFDGRYLLDRHNRVIKGRHSDTGLKFMIYEFRKNGFTLYVKEGRFYKAISPEFQGFPEAERVDETLQEAHSRIQKRQWQQDALEDITTRTTNIDGYEGYEKGQFIEHIERESLSYEIEKSALERMAETPVNAEQIELKSLTGTSFYHPLKAGLEYHVGHEIRMRVIQCFIEWMQDHDIDTGNMNMLQAVFLYRRFAKRYTIEELPIRAAKIDADAVGIGEITDESFKKALEQQNDPPFTEDQLSITADDIDKNRVTAKTINDYRRESGLFHQIGDVQIEVPKIKAGVLDPTKRR